MSAALGLSQLSRLDHFMKKRAQVARWYEKYLANIEDVFTPKLAESTTRVSWFVYVIRLSKTIDRDRFAVLLEDKGVPVRPYFAPIHLQPYMVKMFGYQKGDFPVTEDLGDRSLALPFSSTMTEEEVVAVCQRIGEALGSALRMS
jgi:dTDP-4-amino-4,6-dideoxygalactose transaminase